jgi:hypothetical protein
MQRLLQRLPNLLHTLSRSKKVAPSQQSGDSIPVQYGPLEAPRIPFQHLTLPSTGHSALFRQIPGTLGGDNLKCETQCLATIVITCQHTRRDKAPCGARTRHSGNLTNQLASWLYIALRPARHAIWYPGMMHARSMSWRREH